MSDRDGLTEEFAPVPFPFLARQGPASLRSCAGIVPSRYQHPADLRALRALQNTAGLEELVRAFGEYFTERVGRLENVTQNIRVGPGQLPELYALFADCCARLGVVPEPELYVAQGFNAWTSGSERPCVAVGWPLLQLLSVPQLRYVLGHELGHILMQHSPFHQIAQIAIDGSTAFPFLAAIPLLPTLLKAGLGVALMSWFRTAELSADRAGLLACQDLEAAGRALVLLSGFPPPLADRLDLARCGEQADDLELMSESWVTTVVRFASEASRTHPWPVVRLRELHRWHSGGDYTQLLQEAPAPAATASLWRAAPPDFRCPVCAETVPAGDRFCSRCGAPVRERDRLKACAPASGSRPGAAP
jgi:Zn-dependent protease with chaperone function